MYASPKQRLISNVLLNSRNFVAKGHLSLMKSGNLHPALAVGPAGTGVSSDMIQYGPINNGVAVQMRVVCESGPSWPIMA